jgi:flagellar biogenesis protein FliO
MSDETVQRRPLGLETRVTVLEVEMRAHLLASERIHNDHTTLINKLDDRADRTELEFARLLAKLSVVVSLAILGANVLAPIILHAAGFIPQ